MSPFDPAPPADWQERAACRTLASELFFGPTMTPEAMAACARCPVRAPCADYAAKLGLSGVWGGRMRPEQPQRNRTRERRRKGAA